MNLAVSNQRAGLGLQTRRRQRPLSCCHSTTALNVLEN